jgi:hypothetical protein
MGKIHRQGYVRVLCMRACVRVDKADGDHHAHKTAADRFLVENFNELMLDALKEDDEEESEEDMRAKVLRGPMARLLDPTRPRN